MLGWGDWPFFNQSQKRNSLDLSGLLLRYKYKNDVVVTSIVVFIISISSISIVIRIVRIMLTGSDVFPLIIITTYYYCYC